MVLESRGRIMRIAFRGGAPLVWRSTICSGTRRSGSAPAHGEALPAQR
ncbi:hypothetical protein SCYAM73S_04255 [Streptomyces cyaneofuscatus]